MESKFKNVAKHTGIYSIGNLSTKLIGLILLPLYTSHLTTSDYGVLSVLEITSQLLVAILGLNLSRAMLRWVAVENDAGKRKGIILSTYISVFFMLLIFLSLTLPFKASFSMLFFGDTTFAVYFFYLSLWVGFEIINKVTLDVIRIHEYSFFFITIIIVKFTSVLLLNIYFVAIQGMGVEGIIASQAVGNLIVLLTTLPFVVKSVKGGIPKLAVFYDMVQYSFPLIFSTLSTMILTISDRYLLKLLGSYSQVGIYSLGYKIAGVINVFIIQSFQLGFLPIAYKIFQDKAAKPFFARITTYLVFVLFLAAIGLSAFSREVIILLSSRNEAYWIAYTIVPVISLSFVLKGMKYMFSLGLNYTKQTRYNAYITFIAAVLNILFNFALIPLLGIYGAAIATVVANLVMGVLFYNRSQKAYPIAYEKKRLTILFVSGTFWLGMISMADITGEYAWWRTIIKTVIVVCYPILLYLYGFFLKEEIGLLKGAWKKWKDPAALVENVKGFFKNKDE
ncbi:MAG: lipopolysaccharide biosynthesis protein [Bacteroidota bacterium]